MQIDAYLERIGYDGSPECSAENLARLLRCHLEQVPFENLDFFDDPKELPLDVKDAIIYFVGPTPAKEGQAIGSAGPTTSYRMDAYSPTLIAEGLTGMIGKGKRGPEVIAAMREHGAVYFGAIGGCGALLSKCIKKAEVIAYEDLGAEAIRELVVENFPAVVIIDAEGNNLYETGKADYLATID